jgi:hypothetical protein
MNDEFEAEWNLVTQENINSVVRGISLGTVPVECARGGEEVGWIEDLDLQRLLCCAVLSLAELSRHLVTAHSGPAE